MIEIVPDTGDKLIVLKASGLISEAQVDACVDQLDPILMSVKTTSLVLDWEHLQGWETGAKTAGTIVALRSWAGIRRVALIADDRWADETLRIADIYKAADVQRFAPADRDHALAWAKEA
jgi:hypothetical protein